MKLIDLSHTIVPGMPQWPGDGQPLKIHSPKPSRPGHPHVQFPEFGCHVGTHIDAPLHFLAGEPGIDQLPLDRFMGAGLVIRTGDDRAPGPSGRKFVTEVDLTRARFCSVRHGLGPALGHRTLLPGVVLSFAGTGRLLAGAGLKGVGLDTPSLDPFGGQAAHDICAPAGMINLENLANLAGCRPKGFTLLALPLKLEGTEASPVRAVAMIPTVGGEVTVLFWQICVFAAGIGLLVGGAWMLVGGGSRVAAVSGRAAGDRGLDGGGLRHLGPRAVRLAGRRLQGQYGTGAGQRHRVERGQPGLDPGRGRHLAAGDRGKGAVAQGSAPAAGRHRCCSRSWPGTARLGRLDAGLLFVGFVGFMWWTLKNRDRGVKVAGSWRWNCRPSIRATRLREVTRGSALVVLGVAGLAGGGHFIVSSALVLAVSMGVSETLIGLTLVAVGTSLPELATTIVAALRDEDDLALGNIVGSNLFNILAVAGPVGLFWKLDAEGGQAPITPVFLQPTPLQVQMFCMVLLTVMVFAMIILGRGTIGRKRGPDPAC